MKVRMKLTSLGSVGGVWSPRAGDEIDVSDEAGALLCAKGFAEPVAEPEHTKAEKRGTRGRSKSE